MKHISAVLPQLLMVKDCGQAIQHLLGFLPLFAQLPRAAFDPKLGEILQCLRRLAEAAYNAYHGSQAARGFRSSGSVVWLSHGPVDAAYVVDAICC